MPPDPSNDAGSVPLPAKSQVPPEVSAQAIPSSTDPAREAPKPKDAWDKAAVVSSFLSSVVIAVVGLILTASLQKTQLATSKVTADAQLDLAKYNSDREARLAQSKLTTDLLTHLLSSDPSHRQIAVIALRETVDPKMADSIISVLAQRDTDPAVRVAAMNQLRSSANSAVANTLSAIAGDPKRDQTERSLAEQIGLTVAYNSLVDKNTFLAVAIEGTAQAGNGVLSSALHDVLDGRADSNNDGQTTVDELTNYLRIKVPERSGDNTRLQVSSSLSGSDNIFTSDRIISFVLDSPGNSNSNFYRLYKTMPISSKRLTFYDDGVVSGAKTPAARQKFADMVYKISHVTNSNDTIMIFIAASGSLSKGQGQFDKSNIRFGRTTADSITLEEVRSAVAQLAPRRTFWFVEIDTSIK
jgi:hypothetical protein